MKTIDIHGKQYVTVNERVKYFRANHKDLRLVTTAITANVEFALFKAEIFDTGNLVASSGHAFEIAGGTNINKASHVENCETSAVGRALGFLGIGIDGGIASLDEILNASTVEYIQKLLMKSSVSDEDRTKIEDNLLSMTTGDAQQVIKFLNAHRLDPITQGAGYNQGDIQTKLNAIDKDEKK